MFAKPAASVGAAVLLLASAAPSLAQSNPTVIQVTLDNAGCRPVPATVAAGPVPSQITDTTGDQVSEVELLNNGLIVGKKKTLSPGASGSFSVNLPAGSYE